MLLEEANGHEHLRHFQGTVLYRSGAFAPVPDSLHSDDSRTTLHVPTPECLYLTSSKILLRNYTCITKLPASRSTWPRLGFPPNARGKLLRPTSVTFPIIIIIIAHDIQRRPTILAFWMPNDEDYTRFVHPFPARPWTVKYAHVLVPCPETRRLKKLITLKIHRLQPNQKQ